MRTEKKKRTGFFWEPKTFSSAKKLYGTHQKVKCLKCAETSFFFLISTGYLSAPETLWCLQKLGIE